MSIDKPEDPDFIKALEAGVVIGLIIAIILVIIL